MKERLPLMLATFVLAISITVTNLSWAAAAPASGGLAATAYGARLGTVRSSRRPRPEVNFLAGVGYRLVSRTGCLRRRSCGLRWSCSPSAGRTLH